MWQQNAFIFQWLHGELKKEKVRNTLFWDSTLNCVPVRPSFLIVSFEDAGRAITRGTPDARSEGMNVIIMADLKSSEDVPASL